MGSMQLLNVIQAAPKAKAKAKAKGLLYVDTKINRKPTRTMIDSGVSHNFVSVDEVQRLGLKVVDGEGSIKAVNSAVQRVREVVRGVKTTLGTWQGHLDFSVVPMDDYKVTLRMEFLDKVKAIPISSANTLLIVDKGLNKHDKYQTFWGPRCDKGVARLSGGGDHVPRHFS